MKKAFIISVLSLIGINSATAFDIPWWEQDTVCRTDYTKCYVNMGAGFDTDKWDEDSNCRGMKYICPNALKKPQQEKQLVSRDDISENVSSDFDANILSKTDDCFGVRRSNKKGNEVMVDGGYVKVWCAGILDDPAEETENGGIANANEPVTCGFLEERGYIGVENGKCWGKPYDDSKYYVDCGGEDNKGFAPVRLVILNGTEYSASNSQKQDDVQKQMKEMFSISKNQKAQYFQK